MVLRQAALEGAPVADETVWDGHLHLGWVSRFYSAGETAEKLVAAMDRVGVSVGLVSALWDTGALVKPHEVVRAACADYPGRFYGYLAPHPGMDGFAARLERWGRERCFVGIKLHPALHGKDFLCPEYRFAYAYAVERRMPVLLHCWGCDDVRTMDRLAREYPELRCVAGHSGGERDAVALAIRLAAEHVHLYLDTASTFTYHGAIEAMTEGAGAEKILYGSDAIWNAIEPAIGRILLADISDEGKRSILGLNLRRLVGEVRF